jgi:hypothetical protein
MRKITLNALSMALVGGLLLYWWAFPLKEPPIGAANGVYANICCGQVTLQNGLMTFGNKQYVSYVIERDKLGRYVLPADYIGASESSLIVRRGGVPLKLRLGDEPQPNHLDLMDDRSISVFVFNRSSAK